MKPLRDYAWFRRLPTSEQTELAEYLIEAIEVLGAIVAERKAGSRIDLSNSFWGRVRIASDCWEWTGFTQANNGYGRVNRPAISAKPLFAHRYAYELAIAPVPKGLFVLHHCDNRACVRPSHLYAGTLKQNSDDAVRRGRLLGRRQGRRLWGEERPNHKLTAADVAVIREARELGVPLPVLVDHFGVDDSTISRVARRLRWQHIP